jgi:spore coat polysaccharide biosynthesis protein SpsF (cytidylyltransferase family)/aryl-alcohol dehydrogenase-like predicted oxidoreductase
MTTVVVLQARTGSSRLPAKVLLPVAKMPIVVLAAKRAANLGRFVLTVIPSGADDDVLASVLEHHGLPYFRGSLHSPLERIIGALSSYEADDTVVRLTADNLFPDGELIDQVEREFDTRSVEYLICNGAPCGVPHGLSVEVTKLKHLREAAIDSTSAHDHEHVMPYIARKFGAAYFEHYTGLSKGGFRCTIDNIDDYRSIGSVFERLSNPVEVAANVLIDRLEGLEFQPIQKQAVADLVFGGAQLGMCYGITNSAGRPTSGQVELMLKTAIGNGVVHVDTARAYGQSEASIGASLQPGWEGRAKIITKLAPLDSLPDQVDTAFVSARVDASIFESCVHLRQQCLDVVLLHRATELIRFGGAAWKRLIELRDAGQIQVLGVSVQSPEELLLALADEQVGLIQMPFNIFDWRWDGVLPELISAKARRGLVVHVRSSLLQGLLQCREEEKWLNAHVTQPQPIWDWLEDATRRLGRASVLDLCLSYVRSKVWVDGVVVGMERYEQVIENIRLFSTERLDEAHMAEIEAKRPKLSLETLDPSTWWRT